MDICECVLILVLVCLAFYVIIIPVGRLAPSPEIKGYLDNKEEEEKKVVLSVDYNDSIKSTLDPTIFQTHEEYTKDFISTGSKLTAEKDSLSFPNNWTGLRRPTLNIPNRGLIGSVPSETDTDYNSVHNPSGFDSVFKN